MLTFYVIYLTQWEKCLLDFAVLTGHSPFCYGNAGYNIGELDPEPAAPESTTSPRLLLSPCLPLPNTTLNFVGRLKIPNELMHQNDLNN